MGSFLFWSLLKIINIFDKYPLNTTKQLDYLAWRKAYFVFAVYTKGILDSNIKDKNLSLNNSMNKKRNNFIKSPNQNIKITPYWLLGFIEPLLLALRPCCPCLFRAALAARACFAAALYYEKNKNKKCAAPWYSDICFASNAIVPIITTGCASEYSYKNQNNREKVLFL